MCMQETAIQVAPIVDGRGGGKPDMAMAGRSNQRKPELLEVAGKCNQLIHSGRSFCAYKKPNPVGLSMEVYFAEH